MPIISDGTVGVTNGLKNIVFANAKIFDKGVKSGAWFKIEGENVKYHFAAAPTNNINGTLDRVYEGVTQANVGYQIFNDFTSLGLAIISSAVDDGWDIINFNFEKLDDEINAAILLGSQAGYFQIDETGGLMPITGAASNDPYYELDGNNDIMPKL